MFARFLVRMATFVKEFNGIKGSRLVLTDFATEKEVCILKRDYLNTANRPNNLLTNFAMGSYGPGDEVYDDVTILQIRYRLD